ncbi:MAG: cache domain-containing protein, partial [Phycisphaerae bacterium]
MRSRKWIRLVLVVASAGTIAAVWSVSRSSLATFEQESLSRTQKHLLTIAQAAAARLEVFIQDIGKETRLIAQHPSVVQAAKEGLSAQDLLVRNGYSLEIRTFEDQFDGVSSLCRLDAQGMVQSRLPLEPGKIGADCSRQPCVSRILDHYKRRRPDRPTGVERNSDHTACASEVFTTESGKRAISICAPMLDNDQLVGIIRALVYMETINAQIVDIRAGKHGYAQVFDDDGIMVAHPDHTQIGTDILAVRRKAFPRFDWSEMEALLARMGAGEAGVAVYHSAWWDEDELRIVKKLTGFAPIGIGDELWSLSVTMGYDDIAEPIASHERTLFIAAASMLLAMLVAGVGFYHVYKKKAALLLEIQANQRLRVEVAERERAQEQLRDSEMRIRALLDASPVCN